MQVFWCSHSSITFADLALYREITKLHGLLGPVEIYLLRCLSSKQHHVGTQQPLYEPSSWRLDYILLLPSRIPNLIFLTIKICFWGAFKVSKNIMRLRLMLCQGILWSILFFICANFVKRNASKAFDFWQLSVVQCWNIILTNATTSWPPHIVVHN